MTTINPAPKGTYCRLKLSLPVTGLETDRLRLRPFESMDVDVILEMDMDPEVMYHFPTMPTNADEHAAQFLRDFEEGERFKFFYLIEDKVSGKGVGWIFIRPTEDGCWPELGYRLTKRAWGQGIVPEAAKAMMAYVFKAWGAHAVAAVIVSENHKSIRVAEKLGMTFQFNDIFYDLPHDLYAIAP